MKSRKECWSDSWKISTLVHRLNLIFYVLRVCLQVRHIHKRMPKIITLNAARTNQSPPFANAPPHTAACLLPWYHLSTYVCVPPASPVQIAGRLHLPTQENIDIDSNEFYNLHVSALLAHYATGVGAVNAFLVWFKLVNYLSLSPRFALLTQTIGTSAESSSAFLIIFLLVFFGFTQVNRTS